MARTVQVWSTRSWDGGLNLRDDAFQLAIDELTDCENIKILPQGGVERRPGFTTFDDGSLSDPRNLWQFLGNSVKQVVVQRGNDVTYAASDGSFTTWNPDGLTTTGIMRAATMATLTGAGALNVNDESLYIQRNAEHAPLRFRGSGAASAVLADAAAAFNDSISTPAGGRMPVARYIATHLNYLWHAYTLEGGNTYKNRVRFSHPGEPEDYRTNDYIDIDSGVDGDEIVGLAPLGDRLLVFKKRSIYAITGYSPESFEVFPVEQGIGAASQEAISVSRFGCAFYDPMLGVFIMGDGRPAWLWDKFQAKIKDATIQNAYASKATVGWLDDRLFVSVPWDAGATNNNRTFVYDPRVGKQGAWYVYTYGVGPMLDFRPTDATQLHLGISPGENTILELDSAPTAAADELQGVQIPFDSSITTAWFDLGKPGITKRWRRPTLVFDNDYENTLNIKVYSDYDVVNASREFNVRVDPISGGMVWGVDQWGDPWGGGVDGGQTIQYGSGLGRANALRLKVSAAPQRLLTSTLATEATSGTVYGLSAVYATARDTPTLADASFLTIGQTLSGGFYVCNEGFLSFDTSSIPTNARIHRVALNVTIGTDASDTDFTVYAYRTVYGALTTADYKNQALLALATPTASFDSADITDGTPLTLVFDVSDPENYPVLRGGTTDIFLWSSRHEAGTAPVGDESLTLDIPTASLEVTYSVDQPWGLNNIDFRYIPMKVR